MTRFRFQTQHDQVHKSKQHLGNGIATVAPRVGYLAAEETAHLQHLKKFVKEVGTTEVCQTPMIKGDSEVSRCSTHSVPYLTKGDVRVRLPKPHRNTRQ